MYPRSQPLRLQVLRTVCRRCWKSRPGKQKLVSRAGLLTRVARLGVYGLVLARSYLFGPETAELATRGFKDFLVFL